MTLGKPHAPRPDNVRHSGAGTENGITADVEPLSNVSMTKLPLRKDIEDTEDNSKEVLSNAPDKLGNYFAVPKVVE